MTSADGVVENGLSKRCCLIEFGGTLIIAGQMANLLNPGLH
jgi:hypothetical protein